MWSESCENNAAMKAEAQRQEVQGSACPNGRGRDQQSKGSLVNGSHFGQISYKETPKSPNLSLLTDIGTF
ncbi:hypothetical protein F0562_030903 [Nyssa sinensis]|uniref:Uncharacterized protein n=1 Tax=Nyssa sinensis TaxID=561372 RepID=A0A5J5B018_9ASTE|nr:hypothetical protein F0562_030903 [Nyssa sinensis]